MVLPASTSSKAKLISRNVGFESSPSLFVAELTFQLLYCTILSDGSLVSGTAPPLSYQDG
jgi:hypothetical protein